MVLVGVGTPAGVPFFEGVIWVPHREVIVAEDLGDGEVEGLVLAGEGGFENDAGEHGSEAGGVEGFFEIEGEGVDAEGGKFLEGSGFWDIEFEDDVIGDGAVGEEFLVAVELA